MEQNYQKRDIFALGVLISEVIQGLHPFGKSRLHKASMQDGVKHDEPCFSPTLSPQCVDFLKLCLLKTPFLRPDSWQLLFHPWVRDHALNNEQLRTVQSRVELANGHPCSTEMLRPRSNAPAPNFFTLKAMDIFAPAHQRGADKGDLISVAYSIASTVSAFMNDLHVGCKGNVSQKPLLTPTGILPKCAAGECQADLVMHSCAWSS